MPSMGFSLPTQKALANTIIWGVWNKLYLQVCNPTEYTNQPEDPLHREGGIGVDP